MSAAAARRRKQLAARKQQQEDQQGGASQWQKLLASETVDEPTAYEALQLAQSQVRKKVTTLEFQEAGDLAFQSSLALLQKGRVSVASQLLDVLVEVLRETHTEESETWIQRIVDLHQTYNQAMEAASGSELSTQEILRLHRLQRDWLSGCIKWSSELGTVKFGANKLHELLGAHCWMLSKLEDADEEEELVDLQCDAVQHMVLAEKPDTIVTWLKSLPAPTDEQTKSGHTCAPATRDALLTRSVLVFCAVENLRDANALVRAYMKEVEERDIQELAASYTKKEDGKAPSHIIFCCMLLRICEKDVRTGPLFSWLLRSFKRELDQFYKPQVVMGFTTTIGRVFFNIQPPPSMLNMVENMMAMMGGGGGMPGGINPAMMQAAMAQMQQGGMM